MSKIRVPLTSLQNAARAVRTVPQSTPAALGELQNLLAASEATRIGAPLKTDQRIDSPEGLGWFVGAGLWAGEAGAVRATIEGEVLPDAVADWRALRIDRRDGALYRAKSGDVAGGGGTAVTEHALGQLVGALTAGGTGWRSALAAFVWASPSVASQLLAELQATTKRSPVETVVVRMARHADGRRVTRAVVTGRYSGVHFDDRALLSAIEAELGDRVTTAQARIGRALYGTETRGWVSVAPESKSGVTQTVTWRSSETGQARLSFRASARLKALDAVLVSSRGVEVVDEEEVTLGAAAGAHERNHTLPQIGTKVLAERHPGLGIYAGQRLSESQRAAIADARMRESFNGAREQARQLAEDWSLALKTFAAGCTRDTYAALAAAGVAHEVLLDLCEEQGISVGDDRTALAAVLKDEARLNSIPQGSAAHVAAAYAVLASRGAPKVDGGKVVGHTPFGWAEAQRLQECAGRWVTCGWNAKAHREMR